MWLWDTYNDNEEATVEGCVDVDDDEVKKMMSVM